MLDIFVSLIQIAFVLAVFGVSSHQIFNNIAEEITKDLKGQYLRALLQQEVYYFEENEVESIPDDITKYFEVLTSAISEAYSQLLTSVGVIASGLFISFAQGPILAAICLAYLPLLLVITFSIGQISQRA